MGRVLPIQGLKRGSQGAIGMPLTRSQKLDRALREAAAKRSALRRTPEGVMKLLTQGAQTASALARTGEQVASTIGKIPLPQAMREAATVRAGADPEEALQFLLDREDAERAGVREATLEERLDEPILGDAPVSAPEREAIESELAAVDPQELAAQAPVLVADPDEAIETFDINQSYLGLGATDAERKASILGMAKLVKSPDQRLALLKVAGAAPVMPARVADMFADDFASSFVKEVEAAMPSASLIQRFGATEAGLVRAGLQAKTAGETEAGRKARAKAAEKGRGDRLKFDQYKFATTEKRRAAELKLKERNNKWRRSIDERKYRLSLLKWGDLSRHRLSLLNLSRSRLAIGRAAKTSKGSNQWLKSMTRFAAGADKASNLVEKKLDKLIAKARSDKTKNEEKRRKLEAAMKDTSKLIERGGAKAELASLNATNPPAADDARIAELEERIQKVRQNRAGLGTDIKGQLVNLSADFTEQAAAELLLSLALWAQGIDETDTGVPEALAPQ